MAYDGSDRDRANREARRFAGALEHAAARAQARSRKRWAHPRRMARGASGGATPTAALAAARGRRRRARAARAACADERLASTSYSGRDVPADTIVPFRPTGRNEPFTFELASRDARLILAGDPLNRIAVLAPE